MKLFIKVKCKAYLRKVTDGVYIQYYNSDGTECFSKFVRDYKSKAIVYNGNGKEIADLSGFCGESVEKVYRERVAEDFVGFVVGYTKVDVKGIIGTDWESDPYTGEYGHCFKKITERQSVAVVYFTNNCKRYVPIDDIEEIV